MYIENKPSILIPIEVMDAASNLGEPREVFKRVPLADIVKRMQEPFVKDMGNPNPRNPNLMIEKFSLSMQIFSYRNSDFAGLFNNLNHKFNSVKNLGDLFKGRGPGRSKA